MSARLRLAALVAISQQKKQASPAPAVKWNVGWGTHLEDDNIQIRWGEGQPGPGFAGCLVMEAAGGGAFVRLAVPDHIAAGQLAVAALDNLAHKPIAELLELWGQWAVDSTGRRLDPRDLDVILQTQAIWQGAGGLAVTAAEVLPTYSTSGPQAPKRRKHKTPDYLKDVVDPPKPKPQVPPKPKPIEPATG